jgi:NUBPL iron-transfer P-loop NTPase
VLGLIENMSGYVCPCCGEVSNECVLYWWGRGYGAKGGLTFLGALPLDTELVELLDGEAMMEKEAEAAAGEKESYPSEEAKKEHAFALMERYQKTPTYKTFSGVSEKVLARLQELSSAISDSIN